MAEIGAIRATGANVPETSFYPALANLLNAVGQDLSPKVRCVINLRNRGAGIPDGGLFTADQFKRRARDEDSADPFGGLLPARGAIEAKAPDADLNALAESEQVGKYWERYGLVLITNFRAFALVGKNPNGKPAILERFELAPTEETFHRLTTHPRAAADALGDRLLEYLRRALRHNAPLAAPQDVAALLASYARDALARMEAAAGLPALAGLRDGLEESLGMKFVGTKGEHFFRSTLTQTLFYGVFAAWVIHARRHNRPPATPKAFKDTLREAAGTYQVDSRLFDWHHAGWLLPVPMVRLLFEQVATRSKLEPLGLTETLDWTAAALNRVDRAAFFAAFDEGHAVQYFYEPFLEAFDPELRKQLGVWYTPGEIVEYQVERVDTVLREELDIPDGLADPRVVVLDLCCGTAAYPRAVLRLIARTLREKGGDALVAQELKKTAMERVFGFEILPAPYVVAHLQIGLLLETLGAPLSEAKAERAGIYLTNALTGWEPPNEKHKQQILLPELAEEHDAADRVKRDKPILVILGNPPYNAFAGVSPEEENGLVESYKAGLNTEWGIKKFNLDDLYIRFFRLAEKRIAERGGRGVVSFISNFSYLSDPSFVVMRKRFLEEFDFAWLDCLNGDSRQTGKLTPDGKPDPSVFSTDWNREGIRVGTTIGLFVKTGKPRKDKTVVPAIRFRHFWGAAKRQELVDSLKVKRFDTQYELAAPNPNNRHSFRPSDVTARYLEWPKVTELCGTPPSNGLMEKRGGALMDDDRRALETRMRRYFDATLDWNDLASTEHPLTHDYAVFDAESVRSRALKEDQYVESNLRRYAVRPFETSWCYYSEKVPLWNRSRPTLWAQCWEGHAFFISRFKCAKDQEGFAFYFASGLSDDHLLTPDASAFPMRVKLGSSKENQGALNFGDETGNRITANLSPMARAYLVSLGLPDPDTDRETAELIWMHALAIGFSPAYLTENADGIRQDWPRIPLPGWSVTGFQPVSAKATGKMPVPRLQCLQASAKLGRQVAALLDTETPVPGVTAGTIRTELRAVGQFARVDGGRVDPEAGDFDLTAGWGHGGKGGVTMPGRGKVQRSEVRSQRSERTCFDVFLNDDCCWRNVPEPVWEFTIGGYQVIKKWLSYREKTLLGRSLTLDEVNYVTEMARRLAALVALQSALDTSYREVAE